MAKSRGPLNPAPRERAAQQQRRWVLQSGCRKHRSLAKCPAIHRKQFAAFKTRRDAWMTRQKRGAEHCGPLPARWAEVTPQPGGSCACAAVGSRRQSSPHRPLPRGSPNPRMPPATPNMTDRHPESGRLGSRAGKPTPANGPLRFRHPVAPTAVTQFRGHAARDSGPRSLGSGPLAALCGDDTQSHDSAMRRRPRKERQMARRDAQGPSPSRLRLPAVANTRWKNLRART